MSAADTMIEPLRRQLPEQTRRLAWILIALGIVVCGVGYLVDAERAAFENVVAFLFLASIGGGSIFLVAVEYVGGAVWSVPMRRAVEFLAGVTPIVPLLAIPLLFNMHDLFHWTHSDAVATDAVLQGKTPYLNVPFFMLRFIGVFALWTLFYFLFTRNSVRQDQSHDARLTTTNIRLAAGFLPVFAITVTVLAVDWMMSLEPHWFSTIFGVYYFSGTALAAVAAATLLIVTFHQKGYFTKLRRDHFYSLGALMFAFVNFWAYIAFSQFLLIWYANLPEETFWFMARWQNGWQYASVLLIIVHFAVPYFGLLEQNAKMDLGRLRLMAIWILGAHYLDLYWLIIPTQSTELSISWIAGGFLLLLVGIVLVTLAAKLNRNNLVPVGDPKLERGLQFRL